MDESYDVFSEESWRSFDEPDSGEHLRFLEAVERGDAETAENFLKPGNIDVNRCVSRGYIHFSALHLAALQDDYKMVQILQHYGAKPLARIPIPKSIGEGILQSRIRIALCRAHASPAYILFYSDDPIRTIFNLCCELKEVLDSKGIRNTCRETFEHLIGKCRNLSCKMLDYCFTSNEVDTLLRGKILTTEDDTCCCRHRKEKIIYRTVEMAIHAEQKEFISHNYCQTLLQREWLHGQPSWSKKASKLPIVYYLYAFFVLGVFQLPLGLAYMFTPVCHLWRFFCGPKSKFLMHAISQSFFLTLILLYDMMVSDIPNAKERTEMTLLPMLVIIWGLGLFIQEMADAYRAGFLAHFAFFVNVLDLLTTFILVTVFTARCSWSDSLSTLTSVFLSSFSAFAVVIAGLRFMQNFFLTEFIGPMLMHFANMFRDVLRFLLIFAFVCSAFVFGMHYLYNDASDETAFAKIESAIAALMGTVFGNTLGTSALAIDLNINTTSIDEVKSSSAFFSRMGFLLYSAFCLLCVIVLVNLLLQLCQIHMPDCRKQWISNGNSKERRCGCITSEHQHLHRH
ncbi:short transient receptor potential channel 4-like isoform X1 [Ptychodera flava]|uniref:short transient receptor potential channel 4-like isoform X1 n=1 Tax=Ptychodera flava TaxID=63121 RepID=UPI00396AA41B